ncbi:MAG: acyl-CoA dehydrogenase, partial [Oligoflexales bacterium]|nr:acyl-CoA dehydrogenase [Oligoflexales bacterium]
LISIFLFLSLGFFNAPLIGWSGVLIAILWLFGINKIVLAFITALIVLLNVPFTRRFILSDHVFFFFKKRNFMPKISETERAAIEAGTVWLESEFFSGKPNFDKIGAIKFPRLSDEEQSFLNNEVTTLCSLTSEWNLSRNGDLPDDVLNYLKEKKFFGMTIPKEYGGLGFSSIAHSEVISRLATYSPTLTITVMVPNSLGPAELIMHYGTKEQKDFYLPRLARGEEIPCFALTEPEAGSDAGSIKSTAILFKGQDGEIYLRINFEKRYITLAPIATLIALAVKLKDPDNLLSMNKEDIGITCVLVPAFTKGVELGKRHSPMSVPFYNGPIIGTDVVVSLNQIIGGPKGAGMGWSMLMESLSVGRAISLPSQSSGAVKILAWLTSTYASIRHQFGSPIGKFEGIMDPLAHLAALSYIIESTRLFTNSAVDAGIKPSVVSAIAKYNLTELARKSVNHAMDIMGGSAISMGPKNRIASLYIAAPITITVEGANILTRSLIIFGQGSLRSHPYAYSEIKALEMDDKASFDRAFSSHTGHIIQNICRSFLLSITRGYLSKANIGPSAKYYRRIAWASSSFAIMADIIMAVHGGKLKFRETMTGRYADILSWLYIGSSILWQYEKEQKKMEYRDIFDWSMQYALNKIQLSFDDLYANFKVPYLGWLFQGPILLWSRINRLSFSPSDDLNHKIAAQIQSPSALREKIESGIIFLTNSDDILTSYSEAFSLAIKSAPITQKIKNALGGRVHADGMDSNLLLEIAIREKIITADEADIIVRSKKLAEKVIEVDSYAGKELDYGLSIPMKTKEHLTANRS